MSESSTTILRRLLDERGVKWWPMRNNGYYEDRDTEFVANGKKHTAHEWGDGFAVYNLTPEQAIAATLGSGECEVELRESGWGGYTRHCGACGADLDCDTRNKQNYCPHCGARIRKAVKR